ncbi:hypothetical protein EF910_05370 [Streptomyces sp. WAC07149]|uniref:hypothetical protein n=1 Tax=Streptomyces sp. WAC07149 TaxID=2487425 RepID=UPI000F7A6A6D|nr:hypothetical protein [Streptomyces sp. WAC07149]RST07869.1 hypothetical protein EF910_05370 [Streptomyces sp. WAC07149]
MSFNNIIPGWVAARLAEITTDRSVVRQDADAGPRLDRDDNPTIVVTGTHREGGSSSTEVLHLSLDAGVKLHAKLGEAIKSHRIYQEFTRHD